METFNQNKKTAQIAGVWYFTFIVLSILGSNKALSTLGIALTIAGYVCFLILVSTLYKLLRQVDCFLARLMFVFLATGVAVNFPAARGYGELTASIFWWLWLIPLALLILKSAFIPKFFGVFLLVGCLFHFGDFIGRLFFSDSYLTLVQHICYAVESLAEFSLVIWLLIKGIKKPVQPLTTRKEVKS